MSLRIGWKYWQQRPTKSNSVRGRDLSTSDPLLWLLVSALALLTWGEKSYLGWSIQKIEHVLHTECQNLTSNPKAGEAALKGDEVIGFLDRPGDGLDIERLY